MVGSVTCSSALLGYCHLLVLNLGHQERVLLELWVHVGSHLLLPGVLCLLLLTPLLRAAFTAAAAATIAEHGWAAWGCGGTQPDP